MEKRAIFDLALGKGSPKDYRALRGRAMFTDPDALEEQEMLAAGRERLIAVVS